MPKIITVYSRKDRDDAFFLKYEDRAGDTRYHDLKTKNKREAKRRAKLFIEDVPLSASCNFAEMIQAFIEHLDRLGRAKNTLVAYEERLTNFMKVTGVTDPHTVDKQMINRYITKRQKKNIAPATINSNFRHMKRFYNVAIDQEWISIPNPFVKLEKITEHIEDKRRLTSEEASKLLSEAERYSHEAHIYFSLGLCLGLRRGEIDNAKYNWIVKVKDGYQCLVKQTDEWKKKGRNDHYVPIPAQLLRVLDSSKFGNDEYIFRPDKKKMKAEIRADFRKKFLHVATIAELLPLTPHDLRATMINLNVEDGVPESRVQK